MYTLSVTATVSSTTCGTDVDPDKLRIFFNLPSEIPGDFLTRHIEAACRQIRRDTGLLSAEHEVMQTEEWIEAELCRAYASVLPHLHTFTMQGASKAQGLAAQLDARFMDSTELLRLRFPGKR